MLEGVFVYFWLCTRMWAKKLFWQKYRHVVHYISTSEDEWTVTSVMLDPCRILSSMNAG